MKEVLAGGGRYSWDTPDGAERRLRSFELGIPRSSQRHCRVVRWFARVGRREELP